MKLFLILFFISAGAFGACDYTIPKNLKGAEKNKALCELNFQCAKKEILSDDSDPSELEKLGNFGRSHNCHDELRMAALFDSLDNGLFDPSMEEPAVNNSERGNSKTDLPYIPDAPTKSTRTSRQ